MFLKTADCEIQEILDTKKASSLYEEILANHAKDLAKLSTLDEALPDKQYYNKFRSICAKSNDRLAIVTRAISAYETWGPNKNGDAFEREQLKNYHNTFFLKPHLWDHKLEVPYIRGIIADSRWNNDKDFVETLILIDKESFPKYAREVERGIINSFSMGVEVKNAECSICGNIARTPSELCEHAQKYKGLYIQGKKCFEFNRDLNFIEQSAVAAPADPDSHTLYILAHVKNANHKDMENLRKLAAILDSYTEQDKQKYFDEYYLIETYASRLADRIAKELNIDLLERR
jgi:hypothetical protein